MDIERFQNPAIMVGAFFVLAFSLTVSGAVLVSNGGDSGPSVGGFEEIGTDGETNGSSEIVSFEDGTAVVEGTIVANSGGQSVSVDSVDYSSGEVEVHISTESNSSGVSTTVMVGHQYELTLNNVDQDDEITVIHNEEERFSLNGLESLDDLNFDTDSDVSSNNTTDSDTRSSPGDYASSEGKDVDYNIELVDSSASNTEGSHTVRINEREAVVTGTIVGNMGGQSPVVESINYQDGVVDVNIGLNQDEGQLGTQVITGYSYKLTVSVGNVSDVNVTHSSR